MFTTLLSLALCSLPAWGAEPRPKKESQTGRLEMEIERGRMAQPKYLMEFSFGSSLLYVEQPMLDGYSAVLSSRVLPVPSVLMLAELLIRPHWILAGILNLPTGPVRVLSDDGRSYSEEATAAAVAIGGAYVPFQVQLGEHSTIQPQLGLMLGRTINHSVDDVFFPMAVARLHIHTNTGFSMYFGSAYAGQRDTLALIYGVGHRF